MLACFSDRSFSARRLRRAHAGVMLAASLALAAASTVFLGGCATRETAAVEEDMDVPLPPGEHGLRKLSREEYPDLSAAFAARDDKFSRAIGMSAQWFATGTSKANYSSEQMGPIAQVVSGHEQAAASVNAFKQLAETSADAKAFQDAVYEQFDIWQTRGSNGKGKALFTGYCSPEFKASATRTETFRYPLYRRPIDLVTDTVTGEPLGRRNADGSLGQWGTRKEILDSNQLAGYELMWLSSAFEVYICEVNGSAKLILPDNTVKYVGYAGKTGREYIGLGRSLVDAGVITKRQRNLPSIKALYARDPALVQQYIDKNENMVFFQMYDGKSWPSGSLGVPVTDFATVATDKKIFPRGLVMLVDTQVADYAGRMKDFDRFMLDQDTGGAIRAAGRADIYMGIGAAAEILSGNQYAQGTFYYFVLKPEFVSKYPQPGQGAQGTVATRRKRDIGDAKPVSAGAQPNAATPSAAGAAPEPAGGPAPRN